MEKNKKFYSSGNLPIFALIAVMAIIAGAWAIFQNPSGEQFTIPQIAAENLKSPTIVNLGEAIDVSGKLVEGFAFIDYGKKKEFAKPGTECGNGICEPGENNKKCPVDCPADSEPEPGKQCFEFLAKGAKWRTVEPWLVNPSNNAGLDENFVFTNLGDDIDQWEDAADGTLGDGTIVKILGSGTNVLADNDSNNDSLSADTSSPDGKNEFYFADIETEGAIAVAIVWGVFRGPPSGRELVEVDIVYDDVDFDWSETGEAGKMDFWNIAIHELGHGVGMGHPGDTCTEETMYRFASDGETKKRDLNAGDISGVNELY